MSADRLTHTHTHTHTHTSINVLQLVSPTGNIPVIFFLNNTCLATALRILSFRNNHSIWFSRKAARTWALLIVSVRVYNRRRDAIARVSFAVVLFTALRQASDFPSAHTPPFIFRVSAYSSLHDPPQFHVLPLNSK